MVQSIGDCRLFGCDAGVPANVPRQRSDTSFEPSHSAVRMTASPTLPFSEITAGKLVRVHGSTPKARQISSSFSTTSG